MNVYNSQKESLQYVIEHKTELETASQLALLYIMIISVLCVISHIMTQIVYVKWMKAIQSINDKDNFIRTKSGLLFIIEGFLLLIHPYFFFDNKTFSFIAILIIASYGYDLLWFILCDKNCYSDNDGDCTIKTFSFVMSIINVILKGVLLTEAYIIKERNQNKQ